MLVISHLMVLFGVVFLAAEDGKDKGQVVLGFDSNDDFERLVEVVRKAA